MYILIFILVLFVSVITVLYFKTFSHSHEFFKEDIIKALENKNCHLIKIKRSDSFQENPFKEISIKIAPQIKIGGINGSKVYYRIIVYRDSEDNIKQSWVKLDVEAFVVVKLEWSTQFK